MSLVSICIGTRNRAALLERHLRHIAGFQHLNFEVVVSDNHSDDDTPGVVERMRALIPRLHYVRQPVPLNGWQTVSASCMHAVGDYIVWISDDDYLCEPGLLRAQRIMDEDPAVTAVYGQWQEIFEETGQLGTPLQSIHEEKSFTLNDAIDLFCQYWLLEIPFFRRSTARKWMIPLAFQLPLDFHALACFLLDGKIQLITDTMALISRHPGQHSRRIYEPYFIQSYISDIELFIQTISPHAQFDRVVLYERKILPHYLWCAVRAREDGQYLLARQYLLKAMSFGENRGLPEAIEFQRDHLIATMLEYMDQYCQAAAPIIDAVFEDSTRARNFANLFAIRHPEIPVTLFSGAELAVLSCDPDTLIVVGDPALADARSRHFGVPTRKLLTIPDILNACRLL